MNLKKSDSHNSFGGKGKIVAITKIIQTIKINEKKYILYSRTFKKYNLKNNFSNWL